MEFPGKGARAERTGRKEEHKTEKPVLDTFDTLMISKLYKLN